MCDTYPSILYLPTSASTSLLFGSSRFRSRGRLPALSFYYKDTKVFLNFCWHCHKCTQGNLSIMVIVGTFCGHFGGVAIMGDKGVI